MKDSLKLPFDSKLKLSQAERFHKLLEELTKAPNAASPFLRGSMQKLIAFENHFLREKTKPKHHQTPLSYSLELLSSKSSCKKWSSFCWGVASSTQTCVLISSAWERSQSPLGSLFCKKPLQLPQNDASGAAGVLMHCITPLKVILMQWDTQLPKMVWSQAVECLCLQLHLKFWFCMYICQVKHKNIGFVKQSLMTRKTRPKEASVSSTQRTKGLHLFKYLSY